MSGRGSSAVVAAALALAVGGCGGGDDEDTGPKPPTAKEQKASYVARADQACARFRREDSEGSTQTAGGTAQQARDARLRAARTLDELRSLNPPAQDRAVLDRYFALIEQQVRVELPALERAARGKRQAQARRIFARIRARGEEAKRLATRYGFKVCGQGG